MPTLLQPRSWGAHLLMVLAVAAAVAMGLWQLHVWSASREAAQRDLSHARPVALSSVMGGDSPFPGRSLGRPVRFSGSWLPAGTVYVADRYLDHRRGYWVVTPVRIGQSAMLVVRGWSTTASAPLPNGRVEITGWLQASEGTGEADADPHDDVISSMRVASMTQHVDADLYSGYVVSRTAAAPADARLERVTPGSIPPISTTTALRNLLYAFQWWFFGGFAIYIWFRWCRDQLAPDPEPTEPTEPTEPAAAPDPEHVG